MFDQPVDSGVVITLVGWAGIAIVYFAVIVQKFARLEADVAVVMKFYTNIQDRMVDLIIRTDTPELDKLLLRYKRNDMLSEEDWVRLHDAIEHMHVEYARDENDMSGRKVTMAIFLAAIEARREKQLNGLRQAEQTWLKRLWNKLCSL